MAHNIKAMLVMARERRQRLVDTLECCGIDVMPVCDCDEAQRMFEGQPTVQVVLTDAILPDGDWRRVLEIAGQGRRKIEVVVCSRTGGPELWLDVLQQGGYDVLVEPYQREEIERIIEGATASYLRSSARATS